MFFLFKRKPSPIIPLVGPNRLPPVVPRRRRQERIWNNSVRKEKVDTSGHAATTELILRRSLRRFLLRCQSSHNLELNVIGDTIEVQNRKTIENVPAALLNQGPTKRSARKSQ